MTNTHQHNDILATPATLLLSYCIILWNVKYWQIIGNWCKLRQFHKYSSSTQGIKNMVKKTNAGNC